ncbi:hypothetical protein OROHE_004086 [Orobanche hederae]
MPSQEILKIRDGTPLEADEILTYIKSPRNGSVCYFSSKSDVPSNVVQKKKVARILLFKIRPSQEILKIRDGTPLEIQKKRVARILFFKIRPSQEILKIRDGIHLEAEEIMTYIKSPRNGSVCYFSSKLDVPSNVVQKKKVARILLFKIRPSQEILKIRDGTPLEAEEILTYIKKPSKRICLVARILFFKIRPSQEILKIRDGTPLEAEEILTYIKKPSKRSVCYLYRKFDVPSNVVQKKTVARILFSKIRPSQEILKIRDGTPLEAEEILTYIKKPSKRICFKLDVPSNVVHKKKVARILLFKIRPSQEILKIRDGTPLEAEEILKKRVARILFFKIRPSQEILKIRDGIHLEAEEIMTYIKSPRNGSVCYFSSKLDVPSNVVQKKKVARILLFKIRPSQEILKIRDGTPLEAEEILTYIKKPSKRILARILFFKIRPSQEILKIRDGTPLEAEEILTYIKKPSKRSVCYLYRKFDVPSNVVQKKTVARILFSKIRPSQEILKIRDGTPLEAEEILTYIKKPSKRICLPSQEILKIRDGTPLEAEEILTYIKKPSKRSVCYLYRKFDVPSNVVQKKTVARILFSKISKLDVPSNVVHKKKVARILLFKIRPSQEILKIRDGTPLEAEEILTYIKNNVVQKKRVARILFFKIRPSQEILKIRDGTPLEAEEILTYIKSPRNGSVCYFSSKLDVPSNVVQKKKVARILLFKIRPSQEILKIRDGTPLEAEEILTYIKKPSKRICLPSQEILKIRDGTPLEAEEILTYIKKPSKRSVCYLYSKFDVPSNVVQKKRVARILFSKIRPSQEI